MSEGTEGPIIMWINYGSDGWKPTSYPSVRSALEADRFTSQFIITKPLAYDVVETGK